MAQALERQCWRRLWLRALPSLGLGIGLLLWAIAEPYNAERLVLPGWCFVLPAALIVARALARALRSGFRRENEIIAATVGLWRPRIVLSERLSRAIDEEALRAAYAHESVHVRHRDPLRIWLARLVTDLVWPSQSAVARFRAWRNALELARDEQALATGSVKASDLAAAIMAAVQLQSRVPRLAATLVSEGAFLQARIELLLDAEDAPRPIALSSSGSTTFLLGAVLSLWISLGVTAGEGIVERFLLR